MKGSGPAWPVRLGLSVLGTGYLPKAGGSFAAALALGVAWFLIPYPLILAGIAVVVFFLGVWGSSHAQARGWRHDDPRITADEFCGMLLASLWLPFQANWYNSLLLLGIAFLLFRGFDIFKPWPISLLQRLPGGWGVMLDDVGAAVVANLLVQLTRLVPGGIFRV